MQHQIVISNLSDIDRAAQEFISSVGTGRIIAFYAPMGAGKTTFTTAICRAMGVNGDAVSSPTFAIVNEYRTDAGESIFHFDFYRITKPAEALDSGCTCLMEWPENIEDLLPEETLKVKIEVMPDESRVVTWED